MRNFTDPRNYYLCENCHEERHKSDLKECKICEGLVCMSCEEYHETSHEHLFKEWKEVK